MKRKNVESEDSTNITKKLTVHDADFRLPTLAVGLPTAKCAEKRKLGEIVDKREEKTLVHEEFMRQKRNRLEKTIPSNTVLSTRVSSFTKKNRVEVVNAPKVSVPLYHGWKVPTTTLKSTLADEADSAFNSFNFWRESLPPVEEECGTNNYGDFSWWRVTPPEVLDLDVISDDSE